MRVRGRRERGQRGAAAVEFALISIPLFLLLFGIVQFGWAFYSQITVSQAAREGARYMSLQVPCDDTCLDNAKQKVIDRATGVTLDDGNFDVIQDCAAGSTADDSAYIEVHYEVPIALLFHLTITGKSSSPCGG